jgi:triacylglycerol lipase
MPSFRDETLKRIVGQEPFPEPPLVRLQYPVMLMHGFGMLAGVRRGGHLHSIAMHLRAHGVWAYAPNVASYNTVAMRAEMWEKRLMHILDETGADKVHLVAQSMGGLDARYLTSASGMHPVVASLTTISTPHRGTPLAEFVLNQPDRLRQWASNLANYMSTTALEDASGDVERALVELTPEHLTSHFNPEIPDHPDVPYWSYAGAAGKGTDAPINPVLRFFNSWLYDQAGMNDGFVPVSSARWGTFRGVIPADHAQQVGLQGLNTGTFDAEGFYVDLIRDLSTAEAE